MIIYEVVGIRDGHDETQATEIQKIVCGLTETAFGLYLEKRYLEAMGIYQEILDISSDSVAKVMIEKCVVHSQQGS